jgi:hypothetical protein
MRKSLPLMHLYSGKLLQFYSGVDSPFLILFGSCFFESCNALCNIMNFNCLNRAVDHNRQTLASSGVRRPSRIAFQIDAMARNTSCAVLIGGMTTSTVSGLLAPLASGS